jgi:predicted MFS family arabinose efflux permease
MWFRILVLAVGTFALGTDAFVISGILPDIAHQLNTSVDLAGQLVTVFSLTDARCRGSHRFLSESTPFHC